MKAISIKITPEANRLINHHRLALMARGLPVPTKTDLASGILIAHLRTKKGK